MPVIFVFVWLVGWGLGFRALCKIGNTKPHEVGETLSNAFISFVFWWIIAPGYALYRLYRLIAKRFTN